jgi:hypothetical protein
MGLKSQIPNPKFQTNSKFQFPNVQNLHFTGFFTIESRLGF